MLILNNKFSQEPVIKACTLKPAFRPSAFNTHSLTVITSASIGIEVERKKKGGPIIGEA